MTKMPYENLNDEEFEDLVVFICKEILGTGCKTFAPGKDGAKDSWFEGKAAKYPSTAGPWEGKFIIQAKHTKNPVASCSDDNFSVNKTSVLAKEIERLNELKTVQPFNNYLVFTNRKLPGLAHPSIQTKLKSELGISCAEIFGREEIDRFLAEYPFIASRIGFHRFAPPLRFFEKDLREVIILFSEQKDKVVTGAADIITTFDVLDKTEKNRLNNLGHDYFEFIIKQSTKYFRQIDDFLKDPKNQKYTLKYYATVSDLQARIILDRDRFSDFEHILEHLVEQVVENDADRLREIRNIVRVFVHFMYFNCDIGKAA